MVEKFTCPGRLESGVGPITKVKQEYDQQVLTFNRTIRSYITRVAIKCYNRHTCHIHENRQTGDEGKKKIDDDYVFSNFIHELRLPINSAFLEASSPAKPATEAGDARMSSWEKAPLGTRWDEKNKRGNKETALMYSASCAFLPFLFTPSSQKQRGRRRRRSSTPLPQSSPSLLPYWSPGAEADESGSGGRGGREGHSDRRGGGSGARRGGCTHSEPVSGALDVERAPTEITTNTRHGHKAAPRRSHSKVLFFSCFSFPFIK